jgi:hypothetical protein
VNVFRDFLTEDELALLLPYLASDGFEPGRQGTGYEKLSLRNTHETQALRQRCLVALGLPEDTGHDAYIVRYPAGTSIPLHKDDAPLASEHHRINCMVLPAVRGGKLYVGGELCDLRARDAYTFRPDVEEHEVSEVLAGVRAIFSVGALG